MATCVLHPPARCSPGGGQYQGVKGQQAADSVSLPNTGKRCLPSLQPPSWMKDGSVAMPCAPTDVTGRCRTMSSNRTRNICDLSLCGRFSKSMVSSRERSTLSSSLSPGESARTSILGATVSSHHRSFSSSRALLPLLLWKAILTSPSYSPSMHSSRLRPQHGCEREVCRLQPASEASNAAASITAKSEDQASEEEGDSEEMEQQLRDNDDPVEVMQDKRDVEDILRVVEKLRVNRDMTLNEIRLTIMIEDPRVAAERAEMAIENDVPREEMADALLDVCEDRPVERPTLRALAREMLRWPNLDDDEADEEDEGVPSSGKQKVSPYAAITNTGVDPVVAQRLAQQEFDEAADVGPPEETKELGDVLPPWVGYGFLYTLSAVPIIIVVVVVAVLFVNSLQ